MANFSMGRTMEVTWSSSNMTNTTELPEIIAGPQWVPLDTFIGLILAFSSCFFIGISVIYKKLALKDLEDDGQKRAVDGGFGYLRKPKWWLGICLMALGELSNFVAYIFAPATLVTPLGVFSIVITFALSPFFLKEKIGVIGKLGCALVLVGCIIVTLCGPKDREINSMEELESQLLNPGFLIYGSLVVVISIVFMALVPRYGHRYVFLYITICSSFGSLSVMFCKGVGLAIKQTIGGVNGFTNWATWVCLVALIGALLIETVYMQRALDLFSSSVFMSVNYVMFTSMVIIASSILYTELRELGAKNILLTILGFVVNIVALFLIHVDKEENKMEDSPEIPESNNNDAPLPIKSAKSVLTAVEQGTPLLGGSLVGKIPSSPLAGLNLPHTLFPKTNSCMSLISQVSLQNTNEKEDNQKVTKRNNYENNDDISEHSSSSSMDNSHSSISSNSSSNSSQSEVEHSLRKQPLTDHSSTAERTHCRSVSGCYCEVPLINELHSSTSRMEGSPVKLSRTLSSESSASSGENLDDTMEDHKQVLV